jgi:hypothetical protein
MILRRTCKEVTALLVAREDRALPMVERVALRLHLAACTACPRFERQLEIMRRAFRRWREEADENSPEPPKSGTTAPNSR